MKERESLGKITNFRSIEKMKLLVGLGNHPTEYTQTRHNVGFLFLDFLAEKHQAEDFKSDKKFFGQVSNCLIQGEKCILIKPETYMNLSGKAVNAVKSFYKIEAEDIFLFYDDIDLDFGVVRMREKGSSGGHRGVQSLIDHIGGNEIKRIKFGIANETREKMPTDKFVLQNFKSDELSALPELFAQAHDKLIEILSC